MWTFCKITFQLEQHETVFGEVLFSTGQECLRGSENGPKRSSLEAELLKIEMTENGRKNYHSSNSVFSAAFDVAIVGNYYPIYC